MEGVRVQFRVGSFVKFSKFFRAYFRCGVFRLVLDCSASGMVAKAPGHHSVVQGSIPAGCNPNQTDDYPRAIL